MIILPIILSSFVLFQVTSARGQVKKNSILENFSHLLNKGNFELHFLLAIQGQRVKKRGNKYTTYVKSIAQDIETLRNYSRKSTFKGFFLENIGNPLGNGEASKIEENIIEIQSPFNIQQIQNKSESIRVTKIKSYNHFFTKLCYMIDYLIVTNKSREIAPNHHNLTVLLLPVAMRIKKPFTSKLKCSEDLKKFRCNDTKQTDILGCILYKITEYNKKSRHRIHLSTFQNKDMPPILRLEDGIYDYVDNFVPLTNTISKKLEIPTLEECLATNEINCLLEKIYWLTDLMSIMTYLYTSSSALGQYIERKCVEEELNLEFQFLINVYPIKNELLYYLNSKLFLGYLSGIKNKCKGSWAELFTFGSFNKTSAYDEQRNFTIKTPLEDRCLIYEKLRAQALVGLETLNISNYPSAQISNIVLNLFKQEGIDHTKKNILTFVILVDYTKTVPNEQHGWYCPTDRATGSSLNKERDEEFGCLLEKIRLLNKRSHKTIIILVPYQEENWNFIASKFDSKKIDLSIYPVSFINMESAYTSDTDIFETTSSIEDATKMMMYKEIIPSGVLQFPFLQDPEVPTKCQSDYLEYAFTLIINYNNTKFDPTYMKYVLKGAKLMSYTMWNFPGSTAQLIRLGNTVQNSNVSGIDTTSTLLIEKTSDPVLFMKKVNYMAEQSLGTYLPNRLCSIVSMLKSFTTQKDDNTCNKKVFPVLVILNYHSTTKNELKFPTTFTSSSINKEVYGCKGAEQKDYDCLAEALAKKFNSSNKIISVLIVNKNDLYGENDCLFVTLKNKNILVRAYSMLPEPIVTDEIREYKMLETSLASLCNESPLPKVTCKKIVDFDFFGVPLDYTNNRIKTWIIAAVINVLVIIFSW